MADDCENEDEHEDGAVSGAAGARVKKKGAPPCGLYLRLGPDLALDVLVRDLRQIFYVINASDYERNMHVLEISGPVDDADFADKAAALFALGKRNGIACIWRGTAEEAKRLGADGVLAPDVDSFRAAQALFADGIVGLACGTSQELAALAHDEGADFVSFGTNGPGFPSRDVLRFWAILSDRPALIEGAVTNDYCGYFVQAGASFIDSGAYIWSHGEGVMKATANMLYAIELALEEQGGTAH